jgi:hypothetical protein
MPQGSRPPSLPHKAPTTQAHKAPHTARGFPPDGHSPGPGRGNPGAGGWRLLQALFDAATPFRALKNSLKRGRYRFSPRIRFRVHIRASVFDFFAFAVTILFLWRQIFLMTIQLANNII